MGTKIQWTEEVWNPVTGCTKISPGCKNCYAERMALRLNGRHGYPAKPHHFDVTLRPDRLEQPMKWKKPRRVFVCSMSDLFHDDVPDEFINNILNTLIPLPRHTFQILTKRPKRMQEIIKYEDGWLPSNLWLGVTAEDQKRADERRLHLKATPAVVQFVSFEPALEVIDWTGWEFINQIIIGCESGPKRRPMPIEAALSAIAWAKANGIAPFVKQIEVNGKVSHDPAEWPEVLRVREYPT